MASEAAVALTTNKQSPGKINELAIFTETTKRSTRPNQIKELPQSSNDRSASKLWKKEPHGQTSNLRAVRAPNPATPRFFLLNGGTRHQILCGKSTCTGVRRIGRLPCAKGEPRRRRCDDRAPRLPHQPEKPKQVQLYVS
ncbi:Hypothetical predicted protein [Podarcis lilfordi]|uniref:Uncharacterized protein n=1 Tax=Podarcis lilfordi TaxID=74358 RepID=A0AA35PS63_9SAUR|nr:Hypothetical predicted protein [Podarcis lilfordi]